MVKAGESPESTETITCNNKKLKFLLTSFISRDPLHIPIPCELAR
jgi:hypothetical protein